MGWGEATLKSEILELRSLNNLAQFAYSVQFFFLSQQSLHPNVLVRFQEHQLCYNVQIRVFQLTLLQNSLYSVKVPDKKVSNKVEGFFFFVLGFLTYTLLEN